MQINTVKRPWEKKHRQGTVYKTAATFDYTSTRWRSLRAQKLKQDPFCECDECKGKHIPADMVDHKQRIEDDGDPWDWNNLQSMRNHPCHDKKRAREKNEKYKK